MGFLVKSQNSSLSSVLDIKKKGTNSKKHLVKCLKTIHPWGDQKVTKMETKFYAFVEEVAESRKKKSTFSENGTSNPSCH